MDIFAGEGAWRIDDLRPVGVQRGGVAPDIWSASAEDLEAAALAERVNFRSWSTAQRTSGAATRRARAALALAQRLLERGRGLGLRGHLASLPPSRWWCYASAPARRARTPRRPAVDAAGPSASIASNDIDPFEDVLEHGVEWCFEPWPGVGGGTRKTPEPSVPGPGTAMASDKRTTLRVDLVDVSRAAAAGAVGSRPPGIMKPARTRRRTRRRRSGWRKFSSSSMVSGASSLEKLDRDRAERCAEGGGGHARDVSVVRALNPRGAARGPRRSATMRSGSASRP